MHCLTPVPGGGSGCSCIDPGAILRSAKKAIRDTEAELEVFVHSATKSLNLGVNSDRKLAAIEAAEQKGPPPPGLKI